MSLYFAKRVGNSNDALAAQDLRQEKKIEHHTQAPSQTPFSMMSGITFGFGFGIGLSVAVCAFCVFFGSVLLSLLSKVFSGL
jgi:hypothetical protein